MGHDDHCCACRAYILNIYTDFFPCVVSPCVFIYNAPVIRREMEQKVWNLI